VARLLCVAPVCGECTHIAFNSVSPSCPPLRVTPSEKDKGFATARTGARTAAPPDDASTRDGPSRVLFGVFALPLLAVCCLLWRLLGEVCEFLGGWSVHGHKLKWQVRLLLLLCTLLCVRRNRGSAHVLSMFTLRSPACAPVASSQAACRLSTAHRHQRRQGRREEQGCMDQTNSRAMTVDSTRNSGKIRNHNGSHMQFTPTKTRIDVGSRRPSPPQPNT
jgi:hypothetical protein